MRAKVSIAPKNIVYKLRHVARTFRLGRQEDSHEFLRYLIDGMQCKFKQDTNADKLKWLKRDRTILPAVLTRADTYVLTCADMC